MGNEKIPRQRGMFLDALSRPKWAGAESNRRHMDFQSIALPAELPAPKFQAAYSRSMIRLFKELAAGRRGPGFTGRGVGWPRYLLTTSANAETAAWTSTDWASGCRRRDRDTF